jgi:3',5'-cyclic AMP phosphodiesterase CpdA
MLIAQITDCHISSPGAPEGLQRVAQAIEELEQAPDLILATGDLANDGRPDEYEALRTGLEAFRAPVYLLPGNHDRRETLKSGFPDHGYLPEGPFLHYTIEEHPLRIVAVDTVKPGSHGAEQCADRLAWLDETLSAAAERPTLVAMHHPPFRSGFYRFDQLGFDGLDAFRDLIGRHPQVRKVVCGHLHRVVEAPIGQASMIVAPSTAYGFDFSMGDAPIRQAGDPPAFLLHKFGNDGGIASYTVSA